MLGGDCRDRACAVPVLGALPVSARMSRSSLSSCLSRLSAAVEQPACLGGALSELRSGHVSRAGGAGLFRRRGGLALLLALFTDPARAAVLGSSRRNLELALSLLANSCTEAGSRAQVRQLGGIPALVCILQSVCIDSIWNRVSRALGNLALDPQNGLIIHQSGAVSTLVQILQRSQDGGCLASCLRALRILGDSPAHRVCICEQGGLAPCVLMLTSPDPDLVCAAVRAVCELSRGCSLDCAEQLSLVVPTLAALANREEGKTTVRQAALGTLSNLCNQGALRPLLGNAGAIVLFIAEVKALLEAPTRCTPLVRSLCLCCREALNRRRVRELGGLELLLDLLRNHHYRPIHHKITTAFLHYCHDTTALSMLGAGGLAPLLARRLEDIVGAAEERGQSCMRKAAGGDEERGQSCMREAAGGDEERGQSCMREAAGGGEERGQSCMREAAGGGEERGQSCMREAAGGDEERGQSCMREAAGGGEERGQSCMREAAGGDEERGQSCMREAAGGEEERGQSCMREAAGGGEERGQSCMREAAGGGEERGQSWVREAADGDDEPGAASYDFPTEPKKKREGTSEESLKCWLLSEGYINSLEDLPADCFQERYNTGESSSRTSCDALHTLTSSEEKNLKLPVPEKRIAGSLPCRQRCSSPFSPTPCPSPMQEILGSQWPLGPWSPPTEVWGPEFPLLLLLSRFSQLSDPSSCLVSHPVLRGLLTYVTCHPQPSSRAARLLHRLTCDPSCLEAFIRTGSICTLRARLLLNESPDGNPEYRIRHLERAKELGHALLRNLRIQAESPFGVGVITHMMVSGSPNERRQCALCLPFIYRKRSAHRQQLLGGALQLVLETLMLSLDPVFFFHASECLSSLLTPENYSLPDTSLSITSPKCSYLELLSQGQGDVVFVLDEGDRVEGSRAVVSRQCDVFRAMLQGGYAESQQSEVRVREVPSCAFLPLLHYLHGCSQQALCPTFQGLRTVSGGELAQSSLAHTMAAAGRFLLPGLQNVLENVVRDNLLSLESLPSVYSFAEIYESAQLRRDCCVYLLRGLHSPQQRACALLQLCERAQDKRRLFRLLEDLVQDRS